MYEFSTWNLLCFFAFCYFLKVYFAYLKKLGGDAKEFTDRIATRAGRGDKAQGYKNIASFILTRLRK